MRAKVSLGTIAMGCLLAAGCAGTRPVHYYTLGSPSAPSDRSSPVGPVMIVGSIATPEFLQDGRIRYRAGDNEVGGYEYHRWTEQPGMMVRDSLVRAMSASGNYQRVLEASSSVIGDYLVRGKLYEFGEVDNPGIGSRISLHLELIDRKTNRTLWDHRFEHAEAASGKTIPEVVASLDRNLQAVSEAAAEIGKFLKTAAPPHQ